MLVEMLPMSMRSKHQLKLRKIIFYSTEWFQQQTQFTTEFENMEVEEMNKCLSKFYLSVRKQDGSFDKKTSLLSIREALDRQLKSPPYNKKFCICDGHLFSEANQTLNSHLLVSDVKIAGTVHKNPLTVKQSRNCTRKERLGRFRYSWSSRLTFLLALKAN